MTPTTATRVDKLVALFAVVALAARQQNFPSPALWSKVLNVAPVTIPMLLIVAGVFSLGPLTLLAERRMISKRNQTQRQIMVHLGRLLTLVEQAIPNFPHEDLGLHIWRVRRRLLLPWKKRLQRVGTYRLGGAIVLRQFSPRRGVGVVGLCWKHNREIEVDVEDLRDTLRDSNQYQNYVANHGAEAVMNLSWSAFKDVSHRGSVFASPIRNKRGRFVGCISLDASRGHSALVAAGVPAALNELSNMLSGNSFDEM